MSDLWIGITIGAGIILLLDLAAAVVVWLLFQGSSYSLRPPG
jgi:hypothetical protein